MKIKCTLFAAIFALSTFACEDGGPTSPTFSPDTTATLNTSHTQSGDVPVVDTSSTATDSDILIIGLDRAGITVSSICGGQVSFYVPAKNASYVDVWIPRINDGIKYGHFPVNQEFSISLSPGHYNFQLAVELYTDKGLIQDDRHHGSFSIDVCSPPRTPNSPPETVDVCPNLEGNQSNVPEGLIKDEAGNCVEPPSQCEQVWVIDQQAYDEKVIDQEAYDEVVCTPGEPIQIGWTYKLTAGNDSDQREAACEATSDYAIFSPVGSYQLSECIPGNGAVDACVMGSNQGDKFERKPGNSSTKVKFDHYTDCDIFTTGEPVCETIHHEEVSHVVHHEEIGHFICSVD